MSKRGGTKGGGSATASKAGDLSKATYTKAQEKAFNYYIAGSDYLNVRLRDRVGTGVAAIDREVIRNIKRLDAAMAAAPVLPRMTLYRSIFVMSPDKFLKGGKVGKVFKDRGFSSTSHSGFLKEFSSHANVRMKIHVPAGSRGISLGARNPKEREVILDRGASFRITKATKGPKGVWDVTVTLIQRKK